MQPTAVSIFYKGKLARAEVADGPVAIYDGAAGKVYAIEPAQKTYRVLSLQDILNRPNILQGPSVPSGRRARGMQFSVTVLLQKTDATKQIAGKEARRYLLTASMSMPASRMGSRMGGGGFPGGGFPRRRRGGFPFGGASFLRTPEPAEETASGPAGSQQPSIQVQGECWLTEATLLPAGMDSPVLPLLRQLTTAGPVLRELANQLGKLKLIPLSSHTTATMSGPFAEDQGPLTLTMEVQTIAEGPLHDALFRVPDGYKQSQSDESPASQRFG